MPRNTNVGQQPAFSLEGDQLSPEKEISQGGWGTILKSGPAETDLTADQWRERVRVLKSKGDKALIPPEEARRQAAQAKHAATMEELSKGEKHNAMVFNEQLRRLEDWVTQMTKHNELLNSLFVNNIKSIKEHISIMKQQEQEQEAKLEQHRQRLLALEISVDGRGAAEATEAARIKAEKARIQADESRTQEAPAARATSIVPEADDGLGPPSSDILNLGGGKVINKSKRKKKSKRVKKSKKSKRVKKSKKSKRMKKTKKY